MCKENKLVIAGEPRHDKIYAPDNVLMKSTFGENIDNDKNVLYAPTWRPSGELRLFPFNDMDWDVFSAFLEENNINIFLRMHPSFQEDLDTYVKKTNRIKILDNNAVEDISDVMGFFDALITDYSSIHISFLLLNKPVMFLPYDLKEYTEQMGFIDDYDKLTPGPKPSTMADFHEHVKLLLEDDKYYKDERSEVSNFFNNFSHDNCKMNAEEILQTLS
jgi:CDP-glycerol glycerophosphotransferase